MISSLIASIVFFSLIQLLIGDMKISLAFAFFVFFYSFTYASRIIKKAIHKTKLRGECSNFINTYIVSLSITNSLEQAFKDSCLHPSKNLEKVIKRCGSLDVFDNLNSIATYFSSNNFDVFLNILKLYNNNGGNILEMSMNLQSELRRKETMASSIKQIALRKVYEFISLWAFCLAILIFCRIGLTSIYKSMQTLAYFNYEIIGFFVFLLISIHLIITKTYNSLMRSI